MTVTYISKLATIDSLGCFWRLLFRWKGSVYKLIWKDLLAYSVIYFTLSAIYRFSLGENGRRIFEHISLQTQYYTEMIPVAFVLGFYVSIVIQRWWAQYMEFTWIDTLCFNLSSYISGFDPKDRLLRRTILRYVNLGCTMTFILKSPSVAKRFPSLDHLIDAGFLTPNEKKILEYLQQQYPDPKYSVPFSWAGILAVKARKDGRILNDHALSSILLEIAKLRSHCGDLLSYDWIVIPLVYTQVVTIAVYSFFVATLMGRQFLDPSKGYPQNTSDFVIPFFTYLQFIFYLGWLKTAETLVHPFGDDDDDFDIIYFIERNQQAGVMLVDDMHFEYPLLTQDIYWDRMFPPNCSLTKIKNENNKVEKQKSGSGINYPDGAGGVSIAIGTETNQDRRFAKQKKQRVELSSNQNKCCSLLSVKVEEAKLKKPK